MRSPLKRAPIPQVFIPFSQFYTDSMMDGTTSDEQKKAISKMPYSFNVNAEAKRIKSEYEKYNGKNVSVAGRIVGLRKAGKLLFIDIADSTGKIQLYLDYSVIGEKLFDNAKRFNAGDIIGAKGKVFKTNPGEISINVSKYKQLAKALRPLPEKWKGLQDTETRYRKRYLDIIVNQEIKELFINRSIMVGLIRKFLDKKGFIEAETPVIQPLYGGADAEPFKVHVNTLDEDDYLRISNELYLKRLIIGGLDKVYEIYKAFRNEDNDTTHSAEFTMIEWYQAYADYNKMMQLNEQMLKYLSKKIFGTTEIVFKENKINLEPPFRRIKFIDSINEKVGKDVLALSDEELFALAESNGIRFDKGKRNRSHAYGKLLEVLVQPSIVQPTFVIDFPRETSPLTRPKRGNQRLTERFELYICGMEISNAYSELQNPFIQKENFLDEIKKSQEGDKEAEPLDMEFIEAMEYGMPPTGGLGMGIDRLAMVLFNKPSIKEVILFPMEKRRNDGNHAQTPDEAAVT
jgi:lysyl-tRNA synthetase class 2